VVGEVCALDGKTQSDDKMNRGIIKIIDAVLNVK